MKNYSKKRKNKKITENGIPLTPALLIKASILPKASQLPSRPDGALNGGSVSTDVELDRDNTRITRLGFGRRKTEAIDIVAERVEAIDTAGGSYDTAAGFTQVKTEFTA